MNHRLPRRRRASRGRAVALATVLLVVGAAQRLNAHGALRGSTPAAGAVLHEAPRVIRLEFNEPVETAVTRVALRGPDDAAVPLGAVVRDSVSRRIVTAAVLGVLRSGPYLVTWRTTGRDGHPVSGTVAFTLDLPADTASHTLLPEQHHDAPASDSAFDVASPLYVLARWLQFLGLLTAIGAAVFGVVVLRGLRLDGPTDTEFRGIASARAAALGILGCVVLAGSAIARLVAQTTAMHGSFDVTQLRPMIGSTLWGWAWITQAVAAMVAAVAFASVRRQRAWGWPLAVVVCVVAAATPAMSGHAAAMPGQRIAAVIADTLHVIGAGGWMGGLLVTLVAGVPAAMTRRDADRYAAVASLVNAFSPAALLFAALVAVTGIYAGAIHLGGFGALVESTYGATLLLKLAVLAILAATGAYNWRRVRPALGDPTGTSRLRRSSTIELVAGAAVLLVTAVLVATPPP